MYFFLYLLFMLWIHSDPLVSWNYWLQAERKNIIISTFFMQFFYLISLINWRKFALGLNLFWSEKSIDWLHGWSRQCIPDKSTVIEFQSRLEGDPKPLHNTAEALPLEPIPHPSGTCRTCCILRPCSAASRLSDIAKGPFFAKCDSFYTPYPLIKHICSMLILSHRKVSK